MAKKDHSPRTLLKLLKAEQRNHRQLVDKVDRTSARLERRKIKLMALESRIADLERRTALTGEERIGQGDSEGAHKHAQVIFNPASGRDGEDNAQRLGEVVRCLRNHGIHAHIGLKTSGKTARSLARKSARAGHELVIVAAGDGTIGDVASQLCGTSTVLGIVPIGTMNNVARSLGVPLDIDAACALIAMGTTRQIDVGRVLSNERRDVRYFLEGAGIGLSALGMLAGQAAEKSQLGVVPKALQKFFEAKPGAVHVQMDDIVLDATSSIVTVSNAPLMGGNLLIAPDAKMDDGMLDVTVYDGMGKAALTKHFKSIAKGEADPLKTYRARRVRIESENPVLINSDKDVTPETNVIEIEIIPKALRVIVGNGIGLSVHVEAAPDAPPFAA
ncbi:MAG: diacylglycerol kinase family protein, partial [Candidatus Eisenbacteria bacterium]